MKKIMILNGPNLNMLGVREPEIYGKMTLADIEDLCRVTALARGFDVDFRQSNHEGQLVDWIQEARTRVQGTIINAAAYTHTSVAIHDALKLLDVPVIEVHLSNPLEREGFRHVSYVAPVAAAVFSGEREKSYVKAIEKLADILQ